MRYQIMLGDCTEKMALIESQSVDCVITDPPYPEIDRPYGRLTEAAWWDMMMIVCRETRRILKPTGSAVFILQPNSRKVGSMRGWLWRFMWWVTEEWNMVQDAWWWNITTQPEALAIQGRLMRPSLKACVWVGDERCYRNQDAVIWRESDGNRAYRLAGRSIPSQNQRQYRIGDKRSTEPIRARSAAEQRGGVTPFNVLPIATDGRWNAGTNGHGAGTPLELAAWWTRYICPPGGAIVDPFMGSGTMGLAALAYGCQFIGIEKLDAPGYYPTAAARLAEAALQPMLEFSTTPSNNGLHLTAAQVGLFDNEPESGAAAGEPEH